MVYDCFSFFNELDVLEIRLNTLNAVVDKFIIVEAPWTHTGKPKPLYFNENRQRFATFLDKIIHIVASEPPVSNTATERENAWIRENWQRNEIAKGLTEAEPNDIIIIADLDEIPNPDIIRHLVSLSKSQSCRQVFNLNLRNYAFFLNNLCVSMPKWMGGPQLLKYSVFCAQEAYRESSFSEYCPQSANQIPSATLIRFLPNKKQIKNAGWHFSFVGGIESIQKKLLSFSHTECQHIAKNPEKIVHAICSGKGILGIGDKYMAEPLENGLPHFILQNKERFSALLLPSDIKSWRRATLKRAWFYIAKATYSHFISTLIKIIPKTFHPAMRQIRKKFNV